MRTWLAPEFEDCLANGKQIQAVFTLPVINVMFAIMRFREVAALMALLVCAACSTTRHAETVAAEPQPYTRVTRPDTNSVQLEIAMRQLLPRSGHGPRVWLVGAIHVGEPAYYKTLQKHLDQQRIVLFEGVADRPEDVRGSRPAPTEAAPDERNGFDLQSQLASSLGLVFQLEAIDYSGTNFVHSDLTIADMEALMNGHGPRQASGAQTSGGASENNSLNELLSIMQGDSIFSVLADLGLRFISTQPKLQAMSKLTLIELLGGLQGDLSDLQGVPPDFQQLLKVLLERRNERVFADLKRELASASRKDSIAVFYGAAHMPDLERRLRDELNYRPVADRWLAAFSVNLAQSGISNGEAKMIQGMVGSMLRRMLPTNAVPQ